MNKIELAKSFIESVNCKCGEIHEEGNTFWFSVDFSRGLTLKIGFNEDDEDECFFVSELYELVFLGVYSFDNLKNLIIALNKSEVLEEKMTKFEESDEELWSTEVWLKTMMWYLKTEMFMFTGRLNK